MAQVKYDVSPSVHDFCRPTSNASHLSFQHCQLRQRKAVKASIRGLRGCLVAAKAIHSHPPFHCWKTWKAASILKQLRLQEKWIWPKRTSNSNTEWVGNRENLNFALCITVCWNAVLPRTIWLSTTLAFSAEIEWFHLSSCFFKTRCLCNQGLS